MISFKDAQSAWDNMQPPEDDLPEVPEHLILQICQTWAEDPPRWLRERAATYWIERWLKLQRERRGR